MIMAKTSDVVKATVLRPRPRSSPQGQDQGVTLKAQTKVLPLKAKTKV